jgi:hypothetical protein
LGDSDAPRRSDVATSADQTHIDRADLALDLPGRWDEHTIENGHDLRMADRQQIILSLLPPVQGLDVASSTTRLADAQSRSLTSQCTRGLTASAPIPAATPAGAIRLRVVCQEPRVVATFVAAGMGNQVLSYEHYWYDTQTFSPELDHADDTILATLRLKPRAVCPPEILAQASANGGTCLEAAVLGEAVVEDCRRTLESQAWTRDEQAADLIGHQTAKKLVCYRKAR